MATAQRTQPLGVKIKRLLTEREISQSAFSARTHIKPHQLSRLLNGKRRFGRPAIEASARALAMSPQQLAQGTREAALLTAAAGKVLRDTPVRRTEAARTTRARKTSAGQKRAPRGQAGAVEREAGAGEELRSAAALAAELEACRKQCRLLHDRAFAAEEHARRLAAELGKRDVPKGRGKVFGAALAAGLLGLGVQAVRRFG